MPAGRERDRLVAEDRLAREDGEDLRDDPHRGQDHDVDLGVPEEPERRAGRGSGCRRAAGSKKCVPAWRSSSISVSPAESVGSTITSSHAYVTIAQQKSGMRIQRHAGRAHVVDRHDEVDRADERRDREDVQPEDPEVLAVAGHVQRRERRVHRPAAARGPVRREEAEHQHDAAEEVQPVRQRVQPRERHVARADHQRHEVVAEAGEDRDDDEEDHRRAVHRDDLVVGVLRQDVLVRRRELRADQQRQDAADARRRRAPSRCRGSRCACGRRSSATT